MFLKAKNYKLEACRGYTLIEAIIYISILAMLSVLFISLLFSMANSHTEFRLMRNITSSASLALERLSREIKQARNVDVGGSTPGRLLLNTTDGGGLATTVEFYLSAGTLMLRAGSAAPASTTARYVTVDNLIFRQINTTESSAVKIEMTLSASRGTVSRTEKFYTTAVLRGSY